ncbi:uncharacterized protein LOC143022987 [Oratosquilla oratoria]|uniref:uncharacterized protein LOC143022987 n=1 Tax=Oratosquilla oratoria TaxID=337810 RepID=UPI003F766737
MDSRSRTFGVSANLSPGMEDRKEEVQQDDKEEGKWQEGELEEKLWEVEEFLVTLVDNSRSVVARKDDLPLLPRNTKDFTPFLTELALKNVSPLHKADPDLLRQVTRPTTDFLVCLKFALRVDVIMCYLSCISLAKWVRVSLRYKVLFEGHCPSLPIGGVCDIKPNHLRRR